MLTLRPGTLQGHACSCSQHLAFFSGASAHRRCMHACKHALLRAAVHARPSSPTDATSSTSALGLLRQNQQPSTGLADRTAVSAELAAASMNSERPISSAGGRQVRGRRAGRQADQPTDAALLAPLLHRQHRPKFPLPKASAAVPACRQGIRTRRRPGPPDKRPHSNSHTHVSL